MLESKIKVNHTSAVLFLCGAAIMWSLCGILVKNISWNAMAITGMRSVIALPLYLLVFGINGIKASKVQILGAVFYALTGITLIWSLQLTTAANAALLQYTAPVYVALLSPWLLKEKINWVDWMSIVIVLLGMFLFFIEDLTSKGLWGNIVAILSGVSYALMVICMRKQKDGNAASIIIIGSILMGFISIPFTTNSMMGDKTGWINLILLGVFQTGFAYVFYSLAIKKVTAFEGIMIPIFEPVLIPLWVFFMMGEVPSKYAIVGGIVILSSIVVLLYNGQLKKKKRV